MSYINIRFFMPVLITRVNASVCFTKITGLSESTAVDISVKPNVVKIFTEHEENLNFSIIILKIISAQSCRRMSQTEEERKRLKKLLMGY